MGFVLQNFCWGLLEEEVMDNVTSILLEDVTRFPTTMSPSVPLVLTISDGRQDPEIVWCTGLVGDTLEVLRGQEGTVPKVWPAGSKIWAMLTKAVIEDFGAVPASQVTFTPAGTIAATNVQAAIEELDSETQAQIAAIIASLANYQPLDPLLTSISTVGIGADQLLYGTGADTVAQTTLTSFIRTVLDDASAADVRTTLVLGALAVLNTIATGNIDNDAVTLAKLANIATASFLGRTTAGTGDPEVLTVAQAKTLLNLTGTNSGDQTITLTGDVTGTGTGSFAATIANDAVTNAKAANMATETVKGRAIGAGTGDPTDLSRTQLTALLNAFTSGLQGAAPASGGGTTNFLRADGTWNVPPGGSTVQAALFEDQKANGTAGGTATSGSYVARVLNTTVFNNITGCSLASNQVTLATAGTYVFIGWGSNYASGQGVHDIWNASDGVRAGGHGPYSDHGATGAGSHSVVAGVATIASSKTFELRSRVETTRATDGYGQAVTWTGEVEVYAQLLIIRIA